VNQQISANKVHVTKTQTSRN